MTSQWAGYFFKLIKGNQTAIFPSKYIQFGTWESSPNQREEVKAWRDDYTRELNRITAPGRMSTFSFTTRDNLHEADVLAIYNLFDAFESNSEQRTVVVEFWNNETHSYTQGVFYRPNPKFKIKSATQTDIVYAEQQIEFIQARGV